ncbi:MAG: short-chain dehydrogenase/reductase [Candidatus Nitrosocaldaceae archaeon]|nr:MAG: short-chain dehydrogenase/reductase [Candidatus Nitrosocaldaceae archaeon]GIU72216.1 MAG: short-chain dehydrogenase/reductase [Candidatus Nitrosocaldaceae archaeon]GIU72875.1 MAG: short-chain dehydrogenase/reductase [Candidatus Nitrosocaldaceae archaeon]
MNIVLVSGSNSISKKITEILINKYIVYNINIRNKSLRVIDAYIRDICKRGNIVALINTDNYNILSPFEGLDMKDIKKIFDINLFNTIKLMKLLIPIMKKQKFGKIINIISVAGKVGFPMVSAYSSMQFALEGLCESIRYEVEPYNIKIILVEVGAVKDYFSINVKKIEDEHYSEMIEKMAEGLKILSEHGTDPEDITKIIEQILIEEEPDFRYIIGNDAAMLLEARRSMHDKEFEKFMKEEILPE